MAEEIKSEELLQAVADMREAYKAMRESGSDDPTAVNEANTKVINLTLHSSFLVPAIISSNTQLVQDKENHLKFEDKPQARFMLVKHSQNGTFIPVFTDAAEWREEIDMERAQARKEDAEAWLKDDSNGEHEENEVARAQVAILRAISRMKVAKGGSWDK